MYFIVLNKINNEKHYLNDAVLTAGYRVAGANNYMKQIPQQNYPVGY